MHQTKSFIDAIPTKATPQQNVLILGASYGSLFAIKLLMAGHNAHLVCLPAEAALVNEEGIRVRLPIKGSAELIEVDSGRLPGNVSASSPDEVSLQSYSLVVLAMQEPQYGSTGVRELMARIAKAKLPCMSIMNMPPLTYLKRLPGVDVDACRAAYTDPSLWDDFDPALMTLCSPDPQAFRPPEEKANVLQVRLPTNFKAARFESDVHTGLLRQLEADIDAARFCRNGESIALPVKLKVHESVFVPLAKWSMLVAGNYRCVLPDGSRPIRDAVHADLAVSRDIYEGVMQLCQSLGAATNDLVPFEKYAAAAHGLGSPSSAARALDAGARNIERVELLVHFIAMQRTIGIPALDCIVETVNQRLAKNRALQSA